MYQQITQLDYRWALALTIINGRFTVVFTVDMTTPYLLHSAANGIPLVIPRDPNNSGESGFHGQADLGLDDAIHLQLGAGVRPGFPLGHGGRFAFRE